MEILRRKVTFRMVANGNVLNMTRFSLCHDCEIIDGYNFTTLKIMEEFCTMYMVCHILCIIYVLYCIEKAYQMVFSFAFK